MAQVTHRDRISETSTTEGTGVPYTLAGAQEGNKAFADEYANGDPVWYCATDGTDFEICYGTLDTGAGTLSRSVQASSNGGLQVNWGAGEREIYSVVPAQFFNMIALGMIPLAEGQWPSAAGLDSIAIGRDCVADGNDSISMGDAATSAAHFACVTLGRNVTVTGDEVVAIGDGVTVSANQSVGIGDDVTVNGADAVGIGWQATAGARSVAILGTADAGDTIAIGSGATVNSNATAVAIGFNASVSSFDAVSIGSGNAAVGRASLALGEGTTANGLWSQTFGHDVVNDLNGSACFGIADDAMHYFATAEADTFGATSQTMQLISSADLVVKASRTWAFKGVITARQTGGTSGAVGDSHVFEISGAIKRDGAGNTSMIGTPTVTTLVNDSPATDAWSVSVTADDGTDAIDIEVTGEADKNAHWVARIDIVEAG